MLKLNDLLFAGVYGNPRVDAATCDAAWLRGMLAFERAPEVGGDRVGLVPAGHRERDRRSLRRRGAVDVAGLARTHRGTVQAGRSFLQHGEVTRYGATCAARPVGVDGAAHLAAWQAARECGELMLEHLADVPRPDLVEA